jgi:hypothetical protein
MLRQCFVETVHNTHIEGGKDAVHSSKPGAGTIPSV